MGLNEYGIEKLRTLLRGKEITTIEIVTDLLSAVELDNKGEYPLNAYIRFALSDVEEDLARLGKNAGGEILGGDGSVEGAPVVERLLGGVPVGIKDVISVLGSPATCGSAMLKEYVSPYDAAAVVNLRRNGGVPAGRLNMDEFAMGSSSENSAFGPVRNPHDRRKIPGGSSGGAAAAVAGNLAIAALGSDTGGSIRQPASMCGVFGLKPTYGRVSRYGLVAYASSFDQIGPITKSVADGALLLEAIAGHDGRDSTSANVQTPRFTDFLGQGVKGLRVGVPDEYFGEGLNGEVRSAVEKGIAVLRDAGAVLKNINLSFTKYAVATYYIIATAEASSNLARFDGIRYGTRSALTNDLVELYRENRSRGFGNEVKRRILLGTFTLSSGYYDAYYLKAQKARTLIREDFRKAFSETDLIATPVSPVPAWDIGSMVEDPLAMYLADVYTVPVNLAGLPAASVPCGKTGAGLPVGLQLVADHFNEGAIIRAARVVEEGVR
jgi:aspartyl-tRNA(Asn)/glutamyl-tRNA(Gln) amidotransferase subunit A